MKMCGLAGFVGVTNPDRRVRLTLSLGLDIDRRGGHACGYVTVSDTVRYGRQIGEWRDAGPRFFRAAASGSTAMLHARFATHMNADQVTAAHPFAIKRGRKTALWGAHNGSAPRAHASAVKYQRPYDVDSRELFELLADGNSSEIGQIEGWGVLTWILSSERKAIRIVVASADGAMHVVKTKCGGIVYASTKEIVQDALRFAGMKAVHQYELPVGTVHVARPEPKGAELYALPDAPIQFAERKPDIRTMWEQTADGTWSPKGGWSGYFDDEEAADSPIAKLSAEEQLRLEMRSAGMQVEDDNWGDTDWDGDEFDRAAFSRWCTEQDAKERKKQEGT